MKTTLELKLTRMGQALDFVNCRSGSEVFLKVGRTGSVLLDTKTDDRASRP